MIEVGRFDCVKLEVEYEKMAGKGFKHERLIFQTPFGAHRDSCESVDIHAIPRFTSIVTMNGNDNSGSVGRRFKLVLIPLDEAAD